MNKLTDFWKNWFDEPVNWNENLVSIYRDLGVSQFGQRNWPAHLIEVINTADGSITLRSASGISIRAEADGYSLRKIESVVEATNFKIKYGRYFLSHIESWNFVLSRETNNFYLVIRTTLKPKDQNSPKRERMYHKMKAFVTTDFIMNLRQETS